MQFPIVAPAAQVATLLASLALLTGTVGCRAATGPRMTIETPAGEVVVNVELALTPAKRQRGLMFRNRLGEYEGMLFVFPDARPRSFWMKNTPVPLDIVYIGERGRIVSIAERTEPYSTRAIPSGRAAEYVLEVNGGFADRHGLRPGQAVGLPHFSAAEVH